MNSLDGIKRYPALGIFVSSSSVLGAIIGLVASDDKTMTLVYSSLGLTMGMFFGFGVWLWRREDFLG